MKPTVKRTNRKAPKIAVTGIPAPQPSPPVSLSEDVAKSTRADNHPLENKPETAAPLIPATVKVNFKLYQPHAKRVSLCSEFNGWSPEATPMNRLEDGRWSVTLGLKPGRYQYKFLVDGEWMPDPAARENLLNRYGTLNSVAEISA